MHESVMQWVGDTVTKYGLAKTVTLELGSRDINGTVRPLFNGPYLGVDIVPGIGVDEVCASWSLPFEASMFETIVSTEMIEHDLYPWLTFKEMARVLRPEGHVLITGRGYEEIDGVTQAFKVHDPPDYWRYSMGAVLGLCNYVHLSMIECIQDPEVPGVFLHATL